MNRISAYAQWSRVLVLCRDSLKLINIYSLRSKTLVASSDLHQQQNESSLSKVASRQVNSWLLEVVYTNLGEKSWCDFVLAKPKVIIIDLSCICAHCIRRQLTPFHSIIITHRNFDRRTHPIMFTVLTSGFKHVIKT